MGETIATTGFARVVDWPAPRPVITPTYFPALSSTATGAGVPELARLIQDVGYPRVLASAYDFAAGRPARIDVLRSLRKHSQKGNTLFLDSGVFESYWRNDKKWTMSAFDRSARQVTPDVYTSFDGGVHSARGASNRGAVLAHVKQSLRAFPDALGLAIVHGREPKVLSENVDRLLAKLPDAKGVAIPEREAGPNVRDRAITIRKVRKVLDKHGDLLLHVLGCGHPQAIAAYAWAGADSFDSLDWCQVGLDRLRRSYTDLGLVGTMGCRCRVCESIQVDNVQRSLLHNLAYYQEFCSELQRMIKEATLKDFVIEYFGGEFVSKVPEG